MKDGTTETHELFKVHEASKWVAFLGVRERKFQTVLSQKKNSRAQRAAICAYTAKKLASEECRIWVMLAGVFFHLHLEYLMNLQLLAGP